MTKRRAICAIGLALMLSIGLLGCGADPGAEFLDGDIFDTDLPIGGTLQRIVQGYEQLAAAQHLTARSTFLTVINDKPKAADLSMAKVGVGYVDVRTLGSSEAIQEFQDAYDTDNTNPDARVGLAGVLISRGRPEDLSQAVSLLEGLDAGNANFIYEDRFRLGISNAEVHALLAYAYKLVGETAKSRTQADIARNLDANLDNTTVDQCL